MSAPGRLDKRDDVRLAGPSCRFASAYEVSDTYLTGSEFGFLFLYARSQKTREPTSVFREFSYDDDTSSKYFILCNHKKIRSTSNTYSTFSFDRCCTRLNIYYIIFIRLRLKPNNVLCGLKGKKANRINGECYKWHTC